MNDEGAAEALEILRSQKDLQLDQRLHVGISNHQLLSRGNKGTASSAEAQKCLEDLTLRLGHSNVSIECFNDYALFACWPCCLLEPRSRTSISNFSVQTVFCAALQIYAGTTRCLDDRSSLSQ